MNKTIIPVVPVVVAAGIIYHEGKFLLTRRKLDVHQGGLWEFPGGKQMPGETLEECLKREIEEELAIMVDKVIPFYNLRHSYSDKEVELHFFWCSNFHGTPKPLASLELAWVQKNDLSSYAFPEADQPLLREIIRRKTM